MPYPEDDSTYISSKSHRLASILGEDLDLQIDIDRDLEINDLEKSIIFTDMSCSCDSTHRIRGVESNHCRCKGYHGYCLNQAAKHKQTDTQLNKVDNKPNVLTAKLDGSNSKTNVKIPDIVDSRNKEQLRKEKKRFKLPIPKPHIQKSQLTSKSLDSFCPTASDFEYYSHLPPKVKPKKKPRIASDFRRAKLKIAPLMNNSLPDDSDSLDPENNPCVSHTVAKDPKQSTQCVTKDMKHSNPSYLSREGLYRDHSVIDYIPSYRRLFMQRLVPLKHTSVIDSRLQSLDLSKDHRLACFV